MKAVRACAKQRRLLVIGAAAVALIALLPAGASATLSFAPHVDYNVASHPSAVEVGDFNGDGKLDLAVSRGLASNFVAVLLGNGAGSFTASTYFATDSQPNALAVGDLNDDGAQDIVTANYGANNVSVLLGTGAGSFQAPHNFSTAANPTAIAIADFDNDGRKDVVTADNTANNVQLLLGNGAGSLAAGGTFAVGSSPTSIGVGDFNHDGAKDVAVTNADSNNISVRLGNGAGSFAAATNFNVGTDPYGIAVGDFNHDGTQDLACANDVSHNVSVLLGTGTGSFAAVTNFPAGAHPGRGEIGDFNGDGNQDLAINDAFANTASVMLGDGTGSFAAPISFAVGGGPDHIAAGDFNDDGSQDMAVSNWGTDNVSVLLSAPSADPSPLSLSFGSASSPVPQGTVSPPQTVTVTNNGTAPLVVFGFAVGGTNPDDVFTSTDTCGGQITAGASCTVKVHFAPQAQGSRSATLTVLSNAPSTTPVALSGIAGPLPKGAPGPKGPKGAPGKIRLVTCKVVTVKAKGKNVKRKKCTSKLVSSTVKFTTASAVVRASLSKNGVLFATGTVTKKGLVLHALRQVRSGRYTLTLRYRQGHKQVITRSQIKIV